MQFLNAREITKTLRSKLKRFIKPRNFIWDIVYVILDFVKNQSYEK